VTVLSVFLKSKICLLIFDLFCTQTDRPKHITCSFEIISHSALCVRQLNVSVTRWDRCQWVVMPSRVSAAVSLVSEVVSVTDVWPTDPTYQLSLAISAWVISFGVQTGACDRCL